MGGGPRVLLWLCSMVSRAYFRQCSLALGSFERQVAAEYSSFMNFGVSTALGATGFAAGRRQESSMMLMIVCLAVLLNRQNESFKNTSIHNNDANRGS